MARPKSEIPWLEQRSNGVYYVHWYDADRRRTMRHSLKCQDAEQAKAAFGRFLLGGAAALRRDKTLLGVGAAVEAYLTEHAEVNCADAERQRTIGTHLVSFFQGTPLSRIRIPESRAYAAQRDAAPATIKRELGMLMAVTNHAVKWGRLPKNDVPIVEYPSIPKTEISIFTPAEIKRLMEAGGPAWSFVVLAYFTAARRRSIETLKRSQVDLERRLVNFNKPTDKVTNKRRPKVPLNDACVFHLENLMKLSNTQYVFGKPKSFYRPFRSLCKRVLGRECHPHMLRHSRATHLLQAGQDIFKVAGLLGDTVKTVESTYGHHTPEHAASAVAPSDAGMIAILGS